MHKNIMKRLELTGLLSDEDALSLAVFSDTLVLMGFAGRLRDKKFNNVITYSRKVFIPLTQLCRNVCHYCTFAQTPKKIGYPYLSVDEVIKLVLDGKEMGCKEVLFTLGERPELRYPAARKALAKLGFKTTIEYLAFVANMVIDETGILPHINAGRLSKGEIDLLRPVSASMGMMLESTAKRLCEKGMPHYGSPDKDPVLRLETLSLAGQASVPFTSGILIGIGETRRERIEAMLVLRKLHMEYGHIQEIIIQNFRSKPGTKMSEAPEPELNELLWTIAIARIIFGPEMSIQAPPNLSPGVLPKIIDAGINDWGGVSPVTPDFVNPEAPWPHLETLAQETEISGKYLQERLTLYPDFILNYSKWLDSGLHTRALRMIDTEGYPRTDDWVPGKGSVPPSQDIRMLSSDISITQVSKDVRDIVAQAIQGELLSEKQVIRLFQVRGPEFTYVCKQANKMRSETIGDTVTYVVNRNINNTNVCYFKCQFCAFSKGKTSESLRDTPYDLENSEIARRAKEAWDRGATEVCVQGGINPDYTGQTYLDILSAIRKVVPNMHIHAFSPLEVWQGAKTQGLNIKEFLAQLKQAGLNSLPGTAAEILDDEVRAVLCPDKINTAQWLEVMETAHGLGFGSTATIMFGHIERLEHWARHLIRVRDLQCRTGGFTEFVPLPFVHMQAPIYLKGRSRVGPTFRESVLMHAVSRLVFNSHIKNIQTSWVKMGEGGVLVCLESGANDLGGTLMNESITRAAGSEHGQEKKPQQMERLLRNLDRSSRQRNTLYGVVSSERRKTALTAEELLIVTNTPLHFDSKKKVGKNALVRSVVDLKSSSNVLSVSMEET